MFFCWVSATVGGPSRQKSEIGMYDLVITGLGCHGFHGIILIYPEFRDSWSFNTITQNLVFP
jgi:hypothetical protein